MGATSGDTIRSNRHPDKMRNQSESMSSTPDNINTENRHREESSTPTN